MPYILKYVPFGYTLCKYQMDSWYVKLSKRRSFLLYSCQCWETYCKSNLPPSAIIILVIPFEQRNWQNLISYLQRSSFICRNLKISDVQFSANLPWDGHFDSRGSRTLPLEIRVGMRFCSYFICCFDYLCDRVESLIFQGTIKN